MSSTSDRTHRLRLADLRATRSRVAVLAAVNANPHAGTGTLYAAVRTELPELSGQTVDDARHPCPTPADGTGVLDGFRLGEAEVVHSGQGQDCSPPEASRSHP
ncbi:hypothetical protein [Mycobacterium sp. Lab-001]|uniref:hypothetical protein n=1 Tax=Mycobacterium sp. Lab-001 TaxID=3410136 RepID=UPI003D16F0CA